MDTFDVIVLGTGTAGQNAALDLAVEGFRVAIIENSATPGGTCALRGCQAKKWFYEVAELAARCQHLQNIGITTPPQVDWQQILTEKNNFTAKVPDQTRNNLKGNGVTYIRGKAVFVDKTTIAVDNQHLTADYFIIATGAKTMALPFDGNQYMLTSDDFLELEALPKRIAFVGGGFISFEFAHFAARLGSSRGNIHILEAQKSVLNPFDGDMVDQLVAASEADGIRIHTAVSIESIEKKDTEYTIVFKSRENLVVDKVVNGAGRVPNIDDLNLDAAGINYSRRGITVDEYMQTSNKQVYAAGDCVDSVQLARVADMEAHVAAQAIVVAQHGGTKAAIDYRAVPAVLFTYPQLGMLGKTEEQLKEEKTPYWKSYDTRLTWPTYQRVGLKYAAYKILVDEQNHILGAHFVSDNTTGLLNTFKQAMIDRTPVTELHKNSIMSPYPSRESDIVYMLSPLVD
ncbi:NAD(P)/FAD-dependent oxidoreductase [Desulfopila sp. IMCC35006]|uniref:dihydrolipoyl dehydrogenase family protein n=1 Tax=Desulfopila sp. IMCC35006 TaxID=2569542 RepID=UPI0010ACE55E|nr:NAD(P)/FAD-dependent oxidoreductase [Desulfopila sp. IMCC35006]TKB28350.1 NAD(P)/FAD-dependent oxidoreductase [Desulfopila sp. IMCC35006]